MRHLLLALALLILSTQASFAWESAGELWERALLNAKRHGTLPGPSAGAEMLVVAALGCVPVVHASENGPLAPLRHLASTVAFAAETEAIAPKVVAVVEHGELERDILRAFVLGQEQPGRHLPF